MSNHPIGRSATIIGAGPAGLSCARSLQSAGWDVIIFDKGRGPGGRLSTRRSDIGPFDHGAPFFTAEHPTFCAAVHQWQAEGVVASWGKDPTTNAPRFVGHPSMNAFIKAEALSLGVQYGVHIAPLLNRTETGWVIETKTGEAVWRSDVVVVATPAEQSAALLQLASPPLATVARAVRSAPRWTVMAGFEGPVSLPDDLLTDCGNTIDLAIRDSAKPGRPAGERWVLHGTAPWSEAMLETDMTVIGEMMITAFEERVGPLPPLNHLSAHRWRYALTTTPTGQPFGFDEKMLIGTCGDWHLGATVEDAWMSGHALAAELIQRPYP